MFVDFQYKKIGICLVIYKNENKFECIQTDPNENKENITIGRKQPTLSCMSAKPIQTFVVNLSGRIRLNFKCQCSEKGHLFSLLILRGVHNNYV